MKRFSKTLTLILGSPIIAAGFVWTFARHYRRVTCGVLSLAFVVVFAVWFFSGAVHEDANQCSDLELLKFSGGTWRCIADASVSGMENRTFYVGVDGPVVEEPEPEESQVYACEGGGCQAAPQEEGLMIPSMNDCLGASAEGQICWDSGKKMLYLGTGSEAAPLPKYVLSGISLNTGVSGIKLYNNNIYMMPATPAGIAIPPSPMTWKGYPSFESRKTASYT